MLLNYIKIALRNLIKFKAFSFINIIGLAIGIASCILVILFIVDEFNYDTYYPNSENIYRIHLKAKLNEREMEIAQSCAPLASTLMREVPEVKFATMMQPTSNMLITYENKTYIEKNFYWADSVFFDVFTTNFIRGEKKNALTAPHSLVISKTAAKKYFGSENPIGKMMKFEDGTPYRVMAVVEDCKPNSHFHYDFVASFSSRNDGTERNWGQNYIYTYALLNPNSNIERFESNLMGLVEKYVGPEFQNAFKMSFEEIIQAGNYYIYYAMPLTKIHLYSHVVGELEGNGSFESIYILGIIGLFLLLIACINFMNLSTSRSATRAKEVGIRKVLGSTYTKLIQQFLSESIILSFIGLLVAFCIVWLVLPFFNEFTNRNMEFNLFSFWYTIPIILLGVIVIGVISGSYPAFVLSKFMPIVVLKGKIQNTKSGRWLRSSLVVFQFFISSTLFICTIIVYQQLNYVENKKLGFNKDNVIILQRAWALENNKETFGSELLKNKDILAVGGTEDLIGDQYSNSLFQIHYDGQESRTMFSISAIDSGLKDVFKLKIHEGRFFNKDYGMDSLSVVINETAVKTLGIKNPLESYITQFTRAGEIKLKIIGVLKDYNFETLHLSIKPLLLSYRPNASRYYCIRYNTKNLPELLRYIENTWNKVAPGRVFSYVFMDENYHKLYESEQKLGTIFIICSGLAVFIACLGLFGLAAFTIEQKTKEIGIRKTLGATVTSIMFKYIKNFLKYVIIANLLSIPVGYFLMSKWLNNFAYKIDINITPFAYAVILSTVIALTTITYQVLRAAFANPIKSLKYE